MVRELQSASAIATDVPDLAVVGRRALPLPEESDDEVVLPRDDDNEVDEKSEDNEENSEESDVDDDAPDMTSGFWPESGQAVAAESEEESEDVGGFLFDIPTEVAVQERFRLRGELPDDIDVDRLACPAFDDESFEGVYNPDHDVAFVSDDWLLAVLYPAFPDVNAVADEDDEEINLTASMMLTDDNVEKIKSLFFITGGWTDNTATEEPGALPTESQLEADEKARQLKAKERMQEAREFGETEDSAFAIGSYVRVVVSDIPVTWVAHRQTHPEWPMLLGGLLPGENKYGMVQCRFKKHRWAPKILKNEDPLLFSIGWRRFQSIPLYAIEDRNNVRLRMMKYTPEHLHCLANFYGPLSVPNTGVVAVRNFAQRVPFYRISATGSILETAENFKVVKKLKLIGRPDEIKKRTVFVKGMFTSDLEVDKCIGAKLQTPSGIRGEIKKPVGTNGRFRAAFEDQLHPNDIVLLKAWTQVEPKKFCNPVLDSPDWRRIRTIAELRRHHQVPIPHKPGSAYVGKELPRSERTFATLRTPKNVLKDLPFDAREVEIREKRVRDKLVAQETDVLMSEFEKRVNGLLDGLQATKQAQVKAREAKKAVKVSKAKAAEAKVDAARAAKEKEKRKKRFMKEGKRDQARRKKMRVAE